MEKKLVLGSEAAIVIPATFGTTFTGAPLVSGNIIAGESVTMFLMNTKRTIGMAAVVLAVGLATYEWNQVKEVRAQAAALVQERTTLQGQIRELRRRASAAEERVAELQRQTKMRTINDAKPFVMPSQGERPKAASSSEGRLTLVSITPEQVRANKGQNIDTSYAALYRQLGWTEAHREQFRNLMLDLQESGERLFRTAVAAAKAQKPKMERAEMFEVLEATNAQTQKEQQAHVRREFGDAAGKALENYQEALPVRSIANQLASALFNSESPITPPQSDQLADILAQHARGPIGKVEIAALDIDAALTQAERAGLLNRVQAAELRRVATRIQEQSRVEWERNTSPTTSLQPGR